MEFRLLGPLEVEKGGRLLPIGGAKQRALLTILLLHANAVVSRDRLIDELWGEREPGTAAHSLDHQISRLRKALESADVVETRPGGYLLHANAEQIDVHRFESLLEQGRGARAAGQPHRAADVLRDALGLWRGGALADVAYEDFARTEAARLEELRLVATEELIEADLALGQDAALVPGLETLIASHPLRERLRGQLMLALYRSGRQAEALRVYADTRTRLVDELGLEPGQPLRDLEQAILRQDPSLDRPTGVARRHPRRLAAIASVLVAAAIATGVVLLTTGGTQSSHAQPLVQPDTAVLIAARTGKVMGIAPVPDAVKVRFGFGSLWSVSADGELTRSNPKTGRTLGTLALAIAPSGLAVGAGSVWVTDANSRTLVRIDPSLNPPVRANTTTLPKAGTDQTSDVIVAAGSVWVGHGGFNPGTFVDRYSAATGKLQHRISILGGEATSLAFADGSLWVASRPAGIVWQIDPRIDRVVNKVSLKKGLCCVAAGGGYVWAADNPDRTVWKLSRSGDILSSVKLPSSITGLEYGDGALWVADGAAGVVVRVDPATDRLHRIRLGHDLTGIDVRNGRVAVGVLPDASDATAGLTGRIVRVAVANDALFSSGAAADPAFFPAGFDAHQLAFGYATCAKLFNYRDVGGDAGKQVVPEVAASLPAVTDGGRTYTFHIRSGYRFSPESNEAVTAESFRHAIERIYSPRLFPGSDEGPYLIVGSAAYRAGESSHISGVSARGDTLVIRLERPVPDLLRVLARAPFCAVPISTPVLAHGISSPVPSAGPYYLATLTPTAAVLKPNPNYPGPRPRHLDAIVFQFGVAPADAAAQIAQGKLDYMLETDPALGPNTAVAQAAGSRYRLTPDGTGSVDYFAFNTARSLFSDPRRREAVQYALDRRALAAIDTALPATRVLSRQLSGFDGTPLYPLQSDVAMAKRLLDGRRFHAVVALFDPSSGPDAAAFARAVTQELSAAGIEASIVPLTNNDFANGEAGEKRKAARSDLVWGGANVSFGDPVDYLQNLYLPPADRAALERIAELSGSARDRAAAALAAKIDRQSLFAVYEDGAIPELVSRRLGCVVNQPEYPGVDLAALCLRPGVR